MSDCGEGLLDVVAVSARSSFFVMPSGHTQLLFCSDRCVRNCNNRFDICINTKRSLHSRTVQQYELFLPWAPPVYSRLSSAPAPFTVHPVRRWLQTVHNGCIGRLRGYTRLQATRYTAGARAFFLETGRCCLKNGCTTLSVYIKTVLVFILISKQSVHLRTDWYQVESKIHTYRYLVVVPWYYY